MTDDWSLDDVKDAEKLHANPAERVITTALAHGMYAIGIGRVKEEDFEKILLRLREVESVVGTLWNWGGVDMPIHADSVYRRLGMWARVSPKNDRDFNAWMKKERLAKAQFEAQKARREAAE